VVVADGSNNRFCIAVAIGLPSIFLDNEANRDSGLLHPDVVSGGGIPRRGRRASTRLRPANHKIVPRLSTIVDGATLIMRLNQSGLTDAYNFVFR
jgi:hypothetical protein